MSVVRVSLYKLHMFQAQFKWTYMFVDIQMKLSSENGKVCASLVSYFKRALLIKFCKTHKTHKHNHAFHVHIDTEHT